MEDWTAVSRAITARLAELRATQMDVASRAKVSLTTLRELQHGVDTRRRRPQTLAAVSEALGWPSGHLHEVLTGQAPDTSNDPLQDLRDQVAALQARVDDLEKKLSD